jgi:hypothetical protein
MSLEVLFVEPDVTQLYTNCGVTNSLTNATATPVSEYNTNVSAFAFLSCQDNRSRYINPATATRDISRLWTDFKKILASFPLYPILFSLI